MKECFSSISHWNELLIYSPSYNTAISFINIKWNVWNMNGRAAPFAMQTNFRFCKMPSHRTITNIVITTLLFRIGAIPTQKWHRQRILVCFWVFFCWKSNDGNPQFWHFHCQLWTAGFIRFAWTIYEDELMKFSKNWFSICLMRQCVHMSADFYDKFLRNPRRYFACSHTSWDIGFYLRPIREFVAPSRSLSFRFGVEGPFKICSRKWIRWKL